MQDINLLREFISHGQANGHSHRSSRVGKSIEFQSVARFNVNVQYGSANQRFIGCPSRV